MYGRIDIGSDGFNKADFIYKTITLAHIVASLKCGRYAPGIHSRDND